MATDLVYYVVDNNALCEGTNPEMSCETNDYWYVSRHLFTEDRCEMTA